MKVVCLLALTELVSLAAGKPGVLAEIDQLEASNSTLLQYPTQFTQNIVPKMIHSHNDYWRDVPLLTALSFGVSSVEADVWAIDGNLLVGHERAALTKERTFDSLYVQPLLKILAAQNPQTEFTVNQSRPNGVFDTSSDISLQLLVDMKTDGTLTLPVVLQALEPLRKLGYLTTFANGVLTQSAVTAVGTGNTPLAGIQALSPRDVFFDAPITELGSSNTSWNVTISPLASGDYSAAIGWNGIGQISDTQLGNLEKLIQEAHDLGLKARLWDTPGAPIVARNNVWQQLLASGADWLNADDLKAASGF